MKIEPCPFCGTKLIRRDSGWVKMFACGQMECSYRVDFADIEKHNRLSRIVRAAEAWVKARRTGTMVEISEAGYALMAAVEGGEGE